MIENPYTTIEQLKTLSQKEQFNMMQREVGSAAKAIGQGRPVLFISCDDTPAGDAHWVTGLYDPYAKSFAIGIPPEPSDAIGRDGKTYSRKGGRFPTVLHAVEMFVVAHKIAEQAFDRQDTTYPDLEFVSKDIFRSRLYGKEDLLVRSRVPLTYQPENSNVLFFNKTAKGRDINPIAIAQSHYDAIQSDETIAEELLRHTMLLENYVTGGNKVIEIAIMRSSETRDYRLFRPARIDHTWADPQQPPVFTGQIINSQGLSVRRYSLNAAGGRI